MNYEWLERLDSLTSSTTAERSVVWVALHMLLQQGVLTKTIALTGSRCDLWHAANEGPRRVLARQYSGVAESLTMLHTGWTFPMQWILSNVGISGRKHIDSQAAPTHDQKDPSSVQDASLRLIFSIRRIFIYDILKRDWR